MRYNILRSAKGKTMTEEVIIEGQWEDIVNLSPKLVGQRVRLTLLTGQVKPSDTTKSSRPLSEIFAEVAASIPDEELAKIPPDFSDQLDHYIYGTPKK